MRMARSYRPLRTILRGLYDTGRMWQAVSGQNRILIFNMIAMACMILKRLAGHILVPALVLFFIYLHVFFLIALVLAAATWGITRLMLVGLKWACLSTVKQYYREDPKGFEEGIRKMVGKKGEDA